MAATATSAQSAPPIAHVMASGISTEWFSPPLLRLYLASGARSWYLVPWKKRNKKQLEIMFFLVVWFELDLGRVRG